MSDMAKNEKSMASQELAKPGHERDLSSAEDVNAFLTKVAAMPPSTRSDERGRLMFAMDATMSRQPTWDQALHRQGEMFVEADRIGGQISGDAVVC